ncbi:hypothetical protein HMPREF9004_0359 [Schaalia cardiffensis F0333]|uniref:Uncharacterized protein n=1 Tax=Schaalia cardiffensis F0333 TaxID=888050 RepID=N6WFK6_9ACTO|nr:hypothetical protein HMPREF9004_0359 [Schaalia cardiffensis F0333]
MIEEGVSTAGRGSGEVALRERDLKTTCFGIIAGIRACSQHENGTFQCPDVAQAGSLVRERGHSSTRTQIAVPHAHGSGVFAQVKPR